jgi:ribonuclease D
MVLLGISQSGMIMAVTLMLKQTLRWLADVCSIERDYIMHNAMYDLGWLWAEGIEVKGRIVDTMIVAALIDENRFSYALNALRP